MGTTTRGLPYPEPTDPVAAGADNIKALAQAIEPWLGRADAQVHLIAPPLGGPWPSPVDGVTEWMGLTATIPTWATKAFVTTTVSGIRPQSADAAQYQFRTRLAAVFDDGNVRWSSSPNDVNVPTHLAWTSSHAVVAGSSTRFSLVVARVSGTGVINAGPPETSLRFLVHYTV